MGKRKMEFFRETELKNKKVVSSSFNILYPQYSLKGITSFS